ncbi:hypothetical protein WS58_26020 [Burkholderia pseudomultivorans]|uniref:DUF2964 family protein n=1 Tax=Burkholderia pseudomultivorans TaxID=1207504 RepID=A0A132EIJ9_9BURK|nr:DUF2964 family protein [Burkholderia pseudomultivorans]EGD02004.1 hypothetical protein B1M_23725 [Burkholderia sp. TJI49]KVC35281.1 hypothetical protein WS55_31940 [Burkholderia pseudomultivorans]KVC36654.1 hypothetical protein WS58_26020 [Burkholderia pseudomultivorans]KVC41578.1 hypothetical protein WS56_32295 [Burkholderia pseudomultivorans]KWF30495.1 hypothetical protein WT56_13785 [Burkholderia pseudomultivorans]
MIRRQYRIVVAAIAVFVTLAGMMAVVTGLLFDDAVALRGGAIALIVGAVGFVVMLNPTAKGEE